jgi:hypothetical protein
LIRGRSVREQRQIHLEGGQRSTQFIMNFSRKPGSFIFAQVLQARRKSPQLFPRSSRCILCPSALDNIGRVHFFGSLQFGRQLLKTAFQLCF